MNQQQVNQLAKLLDLKADSISKKLANNPREFVYIKRRIPPELARQVMSLKIPGIFMQREYRRYYPAGRCQRIWLGLPASMKSDVKALSWLLKIGSPARKVAAASLKTGRVVLSKTGRRQGSAGWQGSGVVD